MSKLSSNHWLFIGAAVLAFGMYLFANVPLNLSAFIGSAGMDVSPDGCNWSATCYVGYSGGEAGYAAVHLCTPAGCAAADSWKQVSLSLNGSLPPGGSGSFSCEAYDVNGEGQSFSDSRSCAGPPPPPPVGGSCAPSHYNCASGSTGPTEERADEWRWWCVGYDGGGDAFCSEAKPYVPPPPVCGNGVIESGEQCDAGGSNGACPTSCSNSCTVNSCSAGIPGCTDPNATNYNPSATVNDGSCAYPPPGGETVPGCTDPNATNYNPSATVNDGSCAYPPLAFDYSLSNSGQVSVTKNSGENAFGQSTITKTYLSGATEGVTLSVSGLPAGVSASFSSNPCNPTCTSTLTFTITPSAPAGTYPLTVTGSPLSKTTNFNLVIVAPAISVTCRAEPPLAVINETVTWTGIIAGGTAPFTYSWSGTGIPRSPAPSTNPYAKAYTTIGLKTAILTVTDSLGRVASCNASGVGDGMAFVNFDPLLEEF